MSKDKKRFIDRIKPTGFKDLVRKIILLICVCVFCMVVFLSYRYKDGQKTVIKKLKRLM